MSIVLLLVILAVVFALLAMFSGPGNVRLAAAGVLCLAVIHVLGAG